MVIANQCDDPLGGAVCDRAAVVARAVVQILSTGGGEADVAAYLRDEFADLALAVISEIRLDDGEPPACRRQLPAPEKGHAK